MFVIPIYHDAERHGQIRGDDHAAFLLLPSVVPRHVLVDGQHRCEEKYVYCIFFTGFAQDTNFAQDSNCDTDISLFYELCQTTTQETKMQ